MAAAFPPEVFQLVLHELDPPTIFSVACTCKSVFEICRMRLAQYRQWHKEFRHVFYQPRSGLSTLMDDLALYRLACTVGNEERIAWHIREFSTSMYVSNSGSHGASNLDLQREEDSGLEKFLDYEPFTSKNEVNAWIEDMKTSSKVSPIVTTLLLRAIRIQTLQMFIEDIEPHYFQRVLEKERSIKRNGQWPSLPFHGVRTLTLSARSTSTSTPVNILPFFPSLMNLFLSEIRISAPKSLTKTDQKSTTFSTRVLPYLVLLYSRGASFEKLALAYLLGISPSLTEVHIEEYGVRRYLGGPDADDLPTLCQVMSTYKADQSISVLHLDSGDSPVNLDTRGMARLKKLELRCPLTDSNHVQTISSMLPTSIEEVVIINENSYRTPQPRVAANLFENFRLEAFPLLKGIQLDLAPSKAIDGWDEEDIENWNEEDIENWNSGKLPLDILRSSGLLICPIGYTTTAWTDDYSSFLRGGSDEWSYRGLLSPKWTFLRWNNLFFRLVERDCSQHHAEGGSMRFIPLDDEKMLACEMRKLEDPSSLAAHARSSALM